jgi:hypothetical protein
MEERMFISKGTNGYYYLYFKTKNDKRNKVSTKTKIKSKALEFYKSFQIDQQELQKNKQTLKEFTALYIPFAKSNLSSWTVTLHEFF